MVHSSGLSRTFFVLTNHLRAFFGAGMPAQSILGAQRIQRQTWRDAAPNPESLPASAPPADKTLFRKIER
jgi:hypothetical protein